MTSARDKLIRCAAVGLGAVVATPCLAQAEAGQF
jgi:hypothetical protein